MLCADAVKQGYATVGLGWMKVSSMLLARLIQVVILAQSLLMTSSQQTLVGLE